MVSRLLYQPSIIYRNDIAKILNTFYSRRRILLTSSYIFERINILYIRFQKNLLFSTFIERIR